MELEFHCLGHERSARRILLRDSKTSPEKLALSLEEDIRKMILENYEVIGVCDDDILIVKKEDRPKLEELIDRLRR